MSTLKMFIKKLNKKTNKKLNNMSEKKKKFIKIFLLFSFFKKFK